MKVRVASFLAGCLLVAGAGLTAQATAPAPAVAAAPQRSLVDLEVGASFAHANTVLGGTNGTFTYNLANPRLSLVGDIAGQYQGNVFGAGLREMVTSYLAGLRYSWAPRGRSVWYTEALGGLGHGDGTAFSGNAVHSVGVSGFAAAVGGGMDYNANARLAFRLFELDWYRVGVSYPGYDHPTNLRFTTGIVLRLGSR